MALNLRKYDKVLEKFMYGDECTISRETSGENVFGATKNNGRENIYEDIPCKFSLNQKDDPDNSNGVYMPVLKQVILFVSLDYDIKAGDLIEGDRKDPETLFVQHIEGICGEPNRFDNHQEIPIQVKGAN